MGSSSGASPGSSPVLARRWGAGHDELLEDARSVGLHPRQHVLIRLDGERGMAVPEAFADHLHGDAGGDEQRAVRVS
jgi:hypothetical protein